MPYVVKNKQTGQYLRASGQWTPSLNQACQFPNARSLPLHLETTRQRDPSLELEILRLPSL